MEKAQSLTKKEETVEEAPAGPTELGSTSRNQSSS